MMATRHSYRSDPEVPAFDDREPLIIFDGMCVLCSRGVEWMLRHDPDGLSRFASIQSPVPQALYRHYRLDADRFDTFMVLTDGVPHLRWDGVLAAGRTLPPPWRWFASVGRLVPRALGDRFYDWVQRNRIGWFGARESCRMPDPREAARFL